MRELHEQVLTRVMLTLFGKLESEEPMVDRSQVHEVIERVMSEMLGLIASEAHKFWHKVGSFLSFFYEMVKDCN